MLKSRALTSILFFSGIAVASWACSSGGDLEGQKVMVSTAGTTATGTAGSGTSGSGAVTAGAPSTAGTGSGQAGSQTSAGSGSGGTSAGSDSGSAGMAGSGTAGMGGAGTAGAGGMAGASGAGGANNSFCGTDAGKVVLFDGTDATFKNWYPRNSGKMTDPNPWTLNADGTMTVRNGGGDILTKMGFQNVCLHVEYQAPKHTYDSTTDPQQRGNSGIYLKGSWEMQVLDTFDLGKTQNDYCGAVYKVSAPLVSACKTGGEWNAYDIEFQGNVCTGGTTTTKAKFIKVNLNGINVQNNVEVPVAETQAGMTPTCDPRGVLLQDHNTIVPVSYRNIWAIPRP